MKITLFGSSIWFACIEAPWWTGSKMFCVSFLLATRENYGPNDFGLLLLNISAGPLIRPLDPLRATGLVYCLQNKYADPISPRHKKDCSQSNCLLTSRV
jgi:hypothetical protein